MRQKKLVRELYQAVLTHDQARVQQLRREEFLKIFRRRARGKSFTPRWTVVSV
jgi:hypothetical protein